MEPKVAGRNVTMTLSPLPANRRKRRFSVEKTAEQVAKESAPNGAAS
jgi:hypothetical protein